VGLASKCSRESARAGWSGGANVTRIKALSLWQPWASWIAEGRKTIETRMWATPYRGDFLVCASKLPRVGMYPSGVAVAIATLYTCRPMTQADELAACCTCEPGRYAWLLRDIRPIRPFPVKGSQGWFMVDLPASVQAVQPQAIAEQLSLFDTRPAPAAEGEINAL